MVAIGNLDRSGTSMQQIVKLMASNEETTYVYFITECMCVAYIGTQKLLNQI